MKKPNPEVKKILRKVGQVQTLVSRAKNAYDNDRAANRADNVIPSLEQAFDLCIEILGDYEQVN